MVCNEQKNIRHSFLAMKIKPSTNMQDKTWRMRWPQRSHNEVARELLLLHYEIRIARCTCTTHIIIYF